MTGIILAGGLSSRLGRDKAFIDIGGRRLIDRVVDSVASVTEQLIIVTNQPEKFSNYAGRAELVKDLTPGLGPLGGIQAGLLASNHDINLVVPCDTPFLRPAVLDYLLENVGESDAFVPRWGGQTHTTVAVYRKTCLPAIDAAIAAKRFKIDTFFNDVNVAFAEESVLYALDPLGATFFNVNTESDFHDAERLSAATDKET